MSVLASLSRKLHALRDSRSQWVTGLLSVVVPVYEVERYLDDCLCSLREQDHENVEIIVVDDGSTDGSRAIADRHAALDPRINVVSRPNGGLSAARNTGVEHATGEFLVFIDSDDVVSRDMFTASISALEESGSDFAVTNYARLVNANQVPAGPWIRAAHAHRRLGCTLAGFPEIQVNATAWSKVYRRNFWEQTGLSFEPGQLYEDQAVSSRAYARARAFDVLPEIGVYWRKRIERTSISQQNATVRNLIGHIEAVDASLAELRDAGQEDALRVRVVQLLQNNMIFFAQHVVGRNEEFLAVLQRALRTLRDLLPRDDYVRGVGVMRKILFRSVLHGRLEEAAAFLEDFDQDIGLYPTEITSEGVRLVIDLPYELDEDDLLLSGGDLSASATVRAAHWQAPGVLEVRGEAFIRNVDLSDHQPRIWLTLVRADESVIELPVTPEMSEEANVAGGHSHADYAPGGFRAEIHTEGLPLDEPPLRLRAHVSVGMLSADDAVTLAGPARAAVRLPSIPHPGRSWLVGHDENGEFWLAGHTWADHAVHCRATEEWLTVELFATGRPTFVLSHPARPAQAIEASEVENDGKGLTVAHFDLAKVREHLRDSQRFAMLTLEAHRSGTVHRILDAPDNEHDLDSGLSEFELTHGPGGAVRLAVSSLAARCRAVKVSEDALTFSIDLLGTSPAESTPVLEGPKGPVHGSWAGQRSGGGEATFSLRRSWNGHEDLSHPTGRYDLYLQLQDGSKVYPSPSDHLATTLPTEHHLTQERVRVVSKLKPRPSLRVWLNAPVPTADRSTRSQRILQQRHVGSHADLDSVFFQALYGEVANGNGLAVHEELRRRGTELTLYWSVADRSVPVPAGGVPVVQNTSEWHEAIGRSRFHMIDVHQPTWFHKPEGQVLIQSMHGYPYKLMGHAWWERRGVNPRQVARFDRRAREWDYFISPASYATPLLESAFLDPAGAHPTVLEIGYPRNDALLSAQAEDTRRRTREALGIGPDQRVVMYAPTFRDYLSADDLTARQADVFDSGRAAAALGEEYVLLIRGHAFNARIAGRGPSGAGQVIDVTDYPDVNHLILASDAAVLDYSSIRFDYALTDKPMVFLVPDREEYDLARGGVIPYEPTAPGPLVSTTDEVIRLVSDLPALTSEYAAERASFRSEYTDLDDGRAAVRLVDAVFGPDVVEWAGE